MSAYGSRCWRGLPSSTWIYGSAIGSRDRALCTGGLGDRVPIDPENAVQAVRAYLREIGAYADQPRLRFRVAVRDQSLVVRVSTPLDLSITVGGTTETAVSATGSAAVVVIVA